MPRGRQPIITNPTYFRSPTSPPPPPPPPPHDPDTKLGPKLARRNNPCELCRERRRKCDYDFPACSRCHRLGKECQYVVTRSPADIEYAAQIFGGMVSPELEELEDEMLKMEHEVGELKREYAFPGHSAIKNEDPNIENFNHNSSEVYNGNPFGLDHHHGHDHGEPKIKRERMSPETSGKSNDNATDSDDDFIMIKEEYPSSPDLDSYHHVNALPSSSETSSSENQKRRSNSGIPTPPPDNGVSEDDSRSCSASDFTIINASLSPTISTVSSTASSADFSTLPFIISSSNDLSIDATFGSQVRLLKSPDSDLDSDPKSFMLDNLEEMASSIGMTIKIKGEHLRFDTTIQEFRDLVVFVTARFGSIGIQETRSLRAHDIGPHYEINKEIIDEQNCHSLIRPPSATTKLGNQPLVVIRDAIRESIKESKDRFSPDAPNPDSTFQHSLIALPHREIVTHLIDVYFCCVAKKYPLMHKGYFMMHFFNAETNPLDSPLLMSMSAFLTSWDCVHLFPVGTRFALPRVSRKALGEFFFNRARLLMEETFDEPSLMSFISLLQVVNYKSGIMLYEKAYTYQNLAMRMGNQMLDEFVSPNSKHSPIEQEIFRRYYYMAVGWGRFLSFFTGGPPGKFGKWSDTMKLVGPPGVMEGEGEELREAVECATEILKHGDSHGKIQLILSGHMERIPIEFVGSIEAEIKSWYSKISNNLRLPADFIEKVGGERRFRFFPKSSQDPYAPGFFAIQANITYHAAWLRLHEPFLPNPAHSTYDPKNQSTLHRRSQLITTKSAKTLTLLCMRLWTFWPCHMEIVALLKAADIHYRNLTVLNSTENEKEYAEARIYLGWCLEAFKGYIELRKNSGGPGANSSDVKTWMDRLEVRMRDALKELKIEF